ncbi:MULTISPECIES: hypothetical protein [unclassified Paenibacillus]|uniref:hypothetical protein n=1 Tax=unclassified Paenibacillus TaxID=185978 RepID=UPI001044C43D|nr:MULTISPECIES: hypothetical protein [unclassified Paenibacillus]NIK68176.1 hypothetical protein [Paenibacillus sp. BK720]
MGYTKKEKTVSSKNKKIPKKNKRKKIKTSKKNSPPLRKRRKKQVPIAVETLNLAPLFASPLDPGFTLSKTDEEVWRRILEAQPKGYVLPDRFTFQRLKQMMTPLDPAPEKTMAQ